MYLKGTVGQFVSFGFKNLLNKHSTKADVLASQAHFPLSGLVKKKHVFITNLGGLVSLKHTLLYQIVCQWIYSP